MFFDVQDATHVVSKKSIDRCLYCICTRLSVFVTEFVDMLSDACPQFVHIGVDCNLKLNDLN